MPMEQHHLPLEPVRLDYARPERRRLWQRVRPVLGRPPVAAAVLLVISGTGLVLGSLSNGAGSPCIPLIWLSGLWYVATRADAENASPRLRRQLAISGVIAMALLPLIFVPVPADASVARDLWRDGWRSKWVSPFGHAILIGGTAGLLWFTIVRACILTGCWRDWRGRKASAGHANSC